jgi:endonuclease YncB( thermonuclease family)
MRWLPKQRVALGLVLMLLPLSLRAEAQRLGPVVGGNAAYCRHAAVPDAITAIAAGGEINLKTGGAARLSGIRLPNKGTLADQALAWLRARTDGAVLVRGSELRDRWGRRSVRIENPDGQLDLARGLVEAGLAIADPANADALCPDDFLATEAAVRQRSLGVWADAGYKPIGSDQADRLKDRTGTFAIVEGRVRSVGERAQWTYLNFGGRWAEDFTVIIPKKTWKRMAERGLDAAAFRGRQVRVRGILEAWQGASLTVEIPEMIERLPR